MFIQLLPPLEQILDKSDIKYEDKSLIPSSIPLLDTYITADGVILSAVNPSIRLIPSLKRTFFGTVIECRRLKHSIDVIVDLNGLAYKGHSLLTLPLTVMFIGDHVKYDFSSKEITMAHPFSTLTESQLKTWEQILSFVSEVNNDAATNTF